MVGHLKTIWVKFDKIGFMCSLREGLRIVVRPLKKCPLSWDRASCPPGWLAHQGNAHEPEKKMKLYSYRGSAPLRKDVKKIYFKGIMSPIRGPC